MDIDLLSKMVKELILDNDKVVLPGLGAFVAEIVPATFSDRGYTINPPYRKLYFRSKPDEGDELVDFYMSTNHLDRDVAEKVIREFISELKSVLHVKKTVIFPGLGRLRATKENAIFFVADEQLDIYPEGFGLEPISLKAHQETAEEVSAVVAELKSIVEPVHEEPLVQEPLVQEPENVPVEETVVMEEISDVAAEDEPVVAQVEVESMPAKTRSGWKTFVMVLLIVLVVSAVLLAAFAVLARIYPGMFDTVLYTPEELDILKH